MLVASQSTSVSGITYAHFKQDGKIDDGCDYDLILFGAGVAPKRHNARELRLSA